MISMKLSKKQIAGLFTFQNVNKSLATILTLLTTFAFIGEDYKAMLVLFSISLLSLFILSSIDYMIKSKKNAKEIPSPFADVLNKSNTVSNSQKSRTEIQGSSKPKESVVKTDNDIVEDLKAGLDKNTVNTVNKDSKQNTSQNRNRKESDYLLDDKNKPTYPRGSSNGLGSNIDDLFLKEEGRDDDRLF